MDPSVRPSVGPSFTLDYFDNYKNYLHEIWNSYLKQWPNVIVVKNILVGTRFILAYGGHWYV